MEKKKIDRIIESIRKQKSLIEDGGMGMMTTGSTPTSAGFSGSSNPKGPTAGFDPVMKFIRRKKRKNK